MTKKATSKKVAAKKVAAKKVAAKKVAAKKAAAKKVAVKKVAAKKVVAKKVAAKKVAARGLREALNPMAPYAVTVLPGAASYTGRDFDTLFFQRASSEEPKVASEIASLVARGLTLLKEGLTSIGAASVAGRKSSTEIPASLPDITIDVSALRPVPVRTSAAMDQHLQLAIIDRHAGYRSHSIASAAEDEVAVIARVGDVDAWLARPDVTPGYVLGSTGEGDFLVTARIRIDRIEAVHADTNVRSLKASQPVHPTLADTVRTMRVAKADLPASVNPAGGAGVVIGIVDYGAGFAHGNFLDRNGKTRLLALWDQRGVAQQGSPLNYGRLYTPKEINRALKRTDPYTHLGYAPGSESTGSHGTHVLDIAAGSGGGSGQAGVAPSADLIFVDVAVSDVVGLGHKDVEKSLGDSVQMLEAVRFIFEQAGDRPCVVNLSLGTYGGPHDGSTLVEQSIDAMLAEKPGRAVVIAAGNSHGQGIHTSGLVPAKGKYPLDVVVGKRGAEVESGMPAASSLRFPSLHQTARTS
jgi:hypothetical protein